MELHHYRLARPSSLEFCPAPCDKPDMQRGFVVLHRPEGPKGPFFLYVAMAETKELALAAVRKDALVGDLEINGHPLVEKTVIALRLEPDEVRRL
jgi:hypothetical protein